MNTEQPELKGSIAVKRNLARCLYIMVSNYQWSISRSLTGYRLHIRNVGNNAVAAKRNIPIHTNDGGDHMT
jgi:hypothetical protein